MTNTLAGSIPAYLWCHLTDFCTLECTHCYADSGPTGTHGAMTEADWVAVLDQAANGGARGVQFIGGEPTLHPSLPRLVDHALGRGLAVEVFTNLVHISAVMWTAFSQAGVNLATSYYSDDADEHASITRRPTHARTKANIVEALRRGIPLRVGLVRLGDDQRIEAARAELVNLGVRPELIGYDELREIGRGARGHGSPARALCGGCGDGVAAVSADGSASPCVFTRDRKLGNIRVDALSTVMAGLPAAREQLVQDGMPVGSGPCGPTKGTGGNCYPMNEFHRSAGHGQ